MRATVTIVVALRRARPRLKQVLLNRARGSAGKAARLTVARVDDKGQPTTTATGTTAQGARNAVVDPTGNIFLVDPMGVRLLVFTATK